jgi:hypothetical protein
MTAALSLTGALALVVAGQLPAEGSPPAQLPGRTVRPAFFGMHDGDPTTWPAASFGSLRLWDSGVSWRQLETAPGTFDFSRLDRVVLDARSRGVRVTLVLGQTPTFHVAESAATPTSREYIGGGATRMPDLAAWRAYVRTVARRYAGQVEALQVWNEPNVAGFWSGTPAQMARLTYWAAMEVRRAEHRSGHHLKLVAPSFVARSNTAVLDAYWRQQVRGRRMSELVDAVALSTYPPRDLGPEASVRLLEQVRRAVLEYRDVDLPVWNSEVNYGIAPGGPDGQPPRLSVERQASYVIRTYLLNAAAGVQRVFWYSWDQAGVASVRLSRADGATTLAGRAVSRVARWMQQGPLVGCTRDPAGTYRCRLATVHGRTTVVWQPSGTERIRVRPGSRVTDLRGDTTVLGASRRLTVDFRPLLVRESDHGRG